MPITPLADPECVADSDSSLADIGAPNNPGTDGSDDRYFLSTAPIWRAIAHLCIPMAAGMSVNVVYNIINAGFIGRLNLTALLAALAFALPVTSILMAVGGVFGVGGGTYISRLLGAEDNTQDPASGRIRIKQVSAFTLWAALGAGTLIAIIGLLFATPIASAAGARGDALTATSQYIFAIFAFAPAMVASFALEQVVRGIGAAKASMNGIIIAAIANLVFDALFILVLGWGIRGAGLAVGLSNVAMSGYYIYWITRKSEALSISPRYIRADLKMLRTVFGVGASELLMSSFIVVSPLVMNWIAIGYGEALIASFGFAQRIVQLPEMICMGLYLGAMPLFAYAYGANNHARLVHSIRAIAFSIAIFTVVFSGIVYVFRTPIVGLFSSDPEVLRDGALILTAMLVSTIFNGFTGLAITLFQATEQIRNATIMSITQGVLFIPIILLANRAWGMTGVIWSMTIAEVLTFSLAAVLLYGARRVLPLRSGEAH